MTTYIIREGKVIAEKYNDDNLTEKALIKEVEAEKIKEGDILYTTHQYEDRNVYEIFYPWKEGIETKHIFYQEEMIALFYNLCSGGLPKSIKDDIEAWLISREI